MTWDKEVVRGRGVCRRRSQLSGWTGPLDRREAHITV